MKRGREYFVVGQPVIIKDGTTHYWIGELVDIDAFAIYIRRSSWIPDIGRHHAVFGTGEPDGETEIEPQPDEMVQSIPRSSANVATWPHSLDPWRKAK